MYKVTGNYVSQEGMAVQMPKKKMEAVESNDCIGLEGTWH